MRRMAQNWNDSDVYLSDLFVGDDPDLTAALEANAEAELPPIDVAAVQGKFLHLLARIRGARNILEIGTLGGYSTIWFARAVGASGRVTTLEFEPKHAEVARANLERAGVGDRVEIRVGAALDSLPSLAGHAPFDLVFIDADKENNSNYVRAALELSAPGTVIVVDNIARDGNIADPDIDDDRTRASRDVLELIASHPRLDATALQIVGSKGWDGIAVALVVEP